MLNYDYTASIAYCNQLGLVWLGDKWVEAADADAKRLEFTQEQVDAAMRHHLFQVKLLFTPSTYNYWNRIKLALWFLLGRK